MEISATMGELDHNPNLYTFHGSVEGAYFCAVSGSLLMPLTTILAEHAVMVC